MKGHMKKNGVLLQIQLPSQERHLALFKEGKVKGHDNKLYLVSINFIEGHWNVLQWLTEEGQDA